MHNIKPAEGTSSSTPMNHIWLKPILVVLLALILLQWGKPDPKPYTEWNVAAGGTKENIRYSSLDQIDTSNVSQLKIAWIYHTKDADTIHHSQIQCTPIIVNGILYGTSPKLKLIALNSTTGKEKWAFNPHVMALKEGVNSVIALNNNRGVTYWEKGGDKRIFFTAGSFLFAINAKTGSLISSFGINGKIDLHDGLGKDVSATYVLSTSPGIIYKDLLIVGTTVTENSDAAPGHIRAYDVRTGKQRWIFHTIPQPGEFGFDTWEDSTAHKFLGGANAWAGFSLDETRGILYAPTGSATFDFWGGRRKGANLFANCIVAINAGTGKYIWHFQTVHHDVWDRDVPSAPSLVTILREGKRVEAVAQTTKTGFIFLLERETGKPVFPIEEKPVPVQTELVGEKLWATQPIPSKPEPFMRQSMTVDDLNSFLPDSSFQSIRNKFLNSKSGHMFTPPSEQGTIFFPGLEGGANWGGAAFDPVSDMLYVNANEIPWIITVRDAVVTLNSETFLEAGQRLYAQHCMSCHGADKKGAGNSPTLEGIEKQYTQRLFTEFLSTGRRMMPSFQYLTTQENQAIASYLLNLKSEQGKIFLHSQTEIDKVFPYWHEQRKFLSKEGYPANKPPWGTLSAINLVTGKLAWRIPLGEYPELKKKGIISGTENYGGPVVTAGGLVFIAATKDGKFRAFNKKTGKLLWETDLPAPGFATPSVFQSNGKQYIVIACGGGKLGTHSGDAYVAFSLPSSK